MVNCYHCASRETCVRRERSKIEVMNVSATRGYSTDEASSSGVDISRGVPRVQRSDARGAAQPGIPKRDEGDGRPRRGEDIS
jgi:hypothetical protein